MDGPGPTAAGGTDGRTGFLEVAGDGAASRRLRDSDLDQHGYVMNLTQVWAHHPELKTGLFALVEQAAEAAGLTYRQRGVLVSACASAAGDSYCSLAWGSRLAAATTPEVAVAVLHGDDSALDPEDRLLARWARRVSADPNAAVSEDIDALRSAGWDDGRIVALTAFVALRSAFSAVNDALGVPPDHELVELAPAQVRAAVAYGRPPAATPPVPPTV